MTKIEQLSSYRSWLQNEMVVHEDAYTNYLETWQEAPPERLSDPYEALLEAWDSMEILVHEDAAYRPSEELNTFLSTNPDKEGVEAYKNYVNAGLALPKNPWVGKIQRKLARTVKG